MAVKEVESPELEPVPEQFQKEEQPEAVPYQVGEQPEAVQVEVVMAAAPQVQAKGPEQFPSAEPGAEQAAAVKEAASPEQASPEQTSLEQDNVQRLESMSEEEVQRLLADKLEDLL